MEIEIKNAINWDNYQSNSLILLKAPKELLEDPDQSGQLVRQLSDLKVKWDIEDSTALWVTSEDIEVSAFNKKEMEGLGWIRKEE